MTPVSPASPLQSPSQQQQQAWTRVYLYTGAGDSSPHKPIGDLVNRANFLMPSQRTAGLPPATIADTGTGNQREEQPADPMDSPLLASSPSVAALALDPMEAAASSASHLQLPMAKLVIEDPKLSDEALYKCDVTYVKGKCPSISLVRLQMMALPSKAQILLLPSSTSGSSTVDSTNVAAAAGPLMSGQLIGPYNENDQLRLDCLVHGGRPAPKSVSWRKIDALGRTINLSATGKFAAGHLPVAATGSGQQVVEVQLNHTLTSADLGAKFECHVEHEAIEEPPARVVVISNSLSGNANGNNNEATQTNPLVHNEDSILDLHPATRGSGGARPADANMEASLASRSKSLDSHVFVDLNVGVASLDLFSVNQRNSSEPFKDGDLIELECVAYNSKPSANITWFNGFEPIEQLEPSSAAGQSTSASNNWNQSQQQQQQKHQRRKRLLQRNQVHQNGDGQTYNTHSFLSIKLSWHENKAQIRCQAQNGPMRQPLVKSIELQVQHAPIVLMEPANGVVVNEAYEQHARIADSGADGDNAMTAAVQPPGPSKVSIYCIYSANPSELAPNSTRWFKDGQLLDATRDLTLSETVTNTGYPVLSISQVHRRHAGLYECQLTNSIGPSERLPASEACRVDVNFRPVVRLRAYKLSADSAPQDDKHSPTRVYQPNELLEVDMSQELVVSGASYVLACIVVEAKPAEIYKFHWQRRAVGTKLDDSASGSQLIGVTESSQFVVRSNFTPSAYTCTAFNALGPSQPSNQIEIQLSTKPGPSFVRLVNDPTARKPVSGDHAYASTVIGTDSNTREEMQQQQTFAAGSEVHLECITFELGQPRANVWSWFKNGQPIHPELTYSSTNINKHLQSSGSSSNNNPSTSFDETDDFVSSRDTSYNPITGERQNFPPSTALTTTNTTTPSAKLPNIISAPGDRHRDGESYQGEVQQRSDRHPSIRLSGSGRYLSLTVQLAHNGNTFSCVARNRLGDGGQSSKHPSERERDSFQLRVAIAPSFVQPLPVRTYWPEKASSDYHADQSASSRQNHQLELVCHVQCDPICQLVWYRNNELLDLKRQTDALSNHVTYQVKQSIIDEDLEANLFKSVQSKLIIQFQDASSGDRRQDRKLERRAYLDGSNYTCQSSPNSMGPAVRSTTKFVVQYPPENVLINVPSDKLSHFVEGSNGPRFACKASGEPQVQYRWFLVKSSASDLAAANLANDAKLSQAKLLQLASTISQSSNPAAAAAARDHQLNEAKLQKPIDQMVSKALDSLTEAGKGANDESSASYAHQTVIELTGSASEQVGGGSSILDASDRSLHRSQAGKYICEASNRLGTARQSVYLNVQYKPTCTTLHLHSLDLTMAPRVESTSKSPPPSNEYQKKTKPFKTVGGPEYSLVRDTSEDFIDLRKMLILSPLLNRHADTRYRGTKSDESELSFSGSIFQTIFNDRGNVDRASQFKSIDAVFGGSDEQKSDINLQNNLLASTDDPQPNQTADSWDKFNMLLLKFLNTYIKQIQNFEEEALDTTTAYTRDKRANRRSSNQQHSMDQVPKEDRAPGGDHMGLNAGSGTKNLLTFACIAQDANPITNLTFDWSFDTISLPETSDSVADNGLMGGKASIKPILIYSNENYTLHVMLARRLDSRSSLNPFQMSLVTLNVVIEPASVPGNSMKAGRQAEGSTNQTSRVPILSSAQGNHNSVYGGEQRMGHQANKNNIQFNHEFYSTKPYNSGSSSFVLNEQNWQEQLGNLLECRISNQIGSSNVCHARVNIDGRLKFASSASASSEFAKWRMPSLASKSLLIISILIGCVLIVIATSVLLLGPYLKGLVHRKAKIERCKEDNNTGQSTSSQKSSMLGLLGNGDTSLQGSSDDDSSARLNHLDKRSQNMAFDMDDLSMSRGCHSSESYTQHQVVDHFVPGIGFDEPRELPESRMVYHVGKYIANVPNNMVDSNLDSFRYRGKIPNDTRQIGGHNQTTSLADSKTLTGSTRSRLLANLKFKSLSKFKVTDRISDISNFASRIDHLSHVHHKNISNTETNTTGLSASALDSELSMKMITPRATASPKFFSPTNLRHSHSGFKRNKNRPEQSYYLFDQNGLQHESNALMMQTSSPRLPVSRSILPAYSNMGPAQGNAYNAMDEFIRQKEIDASLNHNGVTGFYRSRSVRNQALVDHGLYMLKNDLNQFYPQPMNRGPPIYPRNQPPSTTMHRQSSEECRPQAVARSSHQIMAAAGITNQQYNPVTSRFTTPTYNHSYATRGVDDPSVDYNLDTIDSHLDRLPDAMMASGHFPQHNAYANAPTIRSTPYNRGLYDEAANQVVEHIYDVNNYATPDQTPMRGQNGLGQPSSSGGERPCVSQLIQSFNSKAPEST